MTLVDDYLGRVQATVWLASDFVSAAGLAEVTRLVDHGEPAEGMCVLAWVIVNEDVRVPASLVNNVRILSEELVPTEDLPPDLNRYVIVEEG